MQPTGHLLGGAIAEGQGYARRWTSNSDELQDLDLIACMGEIDSEDELISIPAVPGFVLVKWNNNKLRHLPVGYCRVQINKTSTSSQIALVNGFRMKERVAENLKSSPLFPGGKTVAEDKAAIETKATTMDPTFFNSGENIFENGLNLLEAERSKSKTKQSKDKSYQNFVRHCNNVPVETTETEFSSSIASFPPQFLQNYGPQTLFPNFNPFSLGLTSFLLLSPMFDCRLSTDHYYKCRQILRFHQKYKSISPNSIPSFTKTVQSNMVQNAQVDMDYVPALKLCFWPDNIKPFLARIRRSRPLLYQKIKDVHMHVVSKWSQSTSSLQKEFEFRYSFSAIEAILAQNRSHEEKCLNGIARSIYYKYLYKRTTLKSYLVKTTVLWICETNEIKKHTSNRDLAKIWIDFICSKLKVGSCPHYFIQNFDVFQPYKREKLLEAFQILQTQVYLDDERSPKKSPFSVPFPSIMDDDEENYSDSERTSIQALSETFDNDWKILEKEWYGTNEVAATSSNSRNTIPTIFDDMIPNMDLICILFILNGVENQQRTNWSRYMKLMLDYNDRCCYEPLFRNDPRIKSKQTIASFAMTLCMSATMMKWVYEACSTGNCTRQISTPLPADAQSCGSGPDLIKEMYRSFGEYYTGANITAWQRISSLIFGTGINFEKLLLNGNDDTTQNKNQTILDQHPYNEELNPADLMRLAEPFMNHYEALLQQSEVHGNDTPTYSEMCIIS